MAQVNFYSVEVKYTGSIDEYSIEELYMMAVAKQERTGNFEADRTVMVTDSEAKELDGEVKVLKDFPSNHLAIVGFSFISEEI